LDAGTALPGTACAGWFFLKRHNRQEYTPIAPENTLSFSFIVNNPVIFIEPVRIEASLLVAGESDEPFVCKVDLGS
jgi:hypothetical protein